MRGLTLSVKSVIAALAICAPALAIAATPPAVLGELALREECSASSQADMRQCMEQHAMKSQQTLRHAEDRVAEALKNWDEDKKYAEQAQALLKASKAEFVRYRDSQCEFLASLSGGSAGNASQIRRQACIAELNGKRAAQLLDAVSELPQR